MTIKELIIELQKYPEDYQVHLTDTESFTTYPIDKIEPLVIRDKVLPIVLLS